MIYVGGDHFAVETSDAVVEYCERKGFDNTNLGAKSADSMVLLIDLIPQLVGLVRADPGSFGILICGTGAGVEIGANRFSGIRASLATDPQVATWARQYDDANVLCLSGWLTGSNVEPILDAWFDAEFQGNDRLNEQLATFDSWR